MGFSSVYLCNMNVFLTWVTKQSQSQGKRIQEPCSKPHIYPHHLVHDRDNILVNEEKVLADNSNNFAQFTAKNQ